MLKTLPLYMFVIYIAIYFYCYKKNKRYKEKAFLVCVFGFAIMLAALRGISVGTDTQAYSKLFHTINEMTNKQFYMALLYRKSFNQEIGYTLLCRMVSYFTNSVQCLWGICSALFLIPMAMFIYWSKKNVYLMTMLFFASGMYVESLNVMRQYIAVGMSILLWMALCKKEYKKAIFLLIVATLFHKTAIILVLLFWISNIKNKKKSLGYILPGILIVYVFHKKILTAILSGLNLYVSYLFRTNSNTTVGGIVIIWAIYIVVSVLIMLLVNFDKLELAEKNTSYLSIISVYMYIALTLMGINMTAMARVGYYFLPYVIYLVSFAERLFVKKSRLAYTGVLMSAFCAFYYYRTWDYAYQFFWN